jgi:hypothetical protein
VIRRGKPHAATISRSTFSPLLSSVLFCVTNSGQSMLMASWFRSYCFIRCLSLFYVVRNLILWTNTTSLLETAIRRLGRACLLLNLPAPGSKNPLLILGRLSAICKCGRRHLKCGNTGTQVMMHRLLQTEPDIDRKCKALRTTKNKVGGLEVLV